MPGTSSPRSTVGRARLSGLSSARRARVFSIPSVSEPAQRAGTSRKPQAQPGPRTAVSTAEGAAQRWTSSRNPAATLLASPRVASSWTARATSSSESGSACGSCVSLTTGSLPSAAAEQRL